MEDFESIYSLYYKEVYSYLVSVTLDRHIAEEITQETFYRAMKNIKKFKCESSISTWLIGIAKMCWLETCRKNKKFKYQDIETKEDDFNMVDLLCDKDEAMRIHVLLHSLDNPYKEVFHLRVFGELPYDKISKIFGKSESWARVTYYRAKSKLLEKIEEEKNGKKNM